MLLIYKSFRQFIFSYWVCAYYIDFSDFSYRFFLAILKKLSAQCGKWGEYGRSMLMQVIKGSYTSTNLSTSRADNPLIKA